MTSLPPNRRRDTLLRLPLLELDTWHLVVTCPACRGDRYLPINDLALRYGTETTLLAIVPRLRCGAPACRRPPVTVRLRNRFPVHPGPALVDVALLGKPV
jgi:hypothetical protein